MAANPSRPGPRIGLPAMRRTAESPFGPAPGRVMFDFYVDPVRRAGGIPVLLVPVAEDDVDASLMAVEGLVLSGGEDVDPRHYGAARASETKDPDPERDAYELAVARRALELGKPILAICRGLQVLNVALGGTLVQHLPVAAAHDRVDAGTDIIHDVWIDPGSQLASIVGTRIGVNSVHHQGIDRLAEPLRGTARDVDSGLVEGVEAPAASFCLGVQWHPEMLAVDGTPHFALFEALVEASARAGSASGRENEFV